MRLTTLPPLGKSARISVTTRRPELVTMKERMGKGRTRVVVKLQANPDATVELRDGSRHVRGRAAKAQEHDRLWARWRDMGDDVDGYATRRPSGTAVIVLEPRPASN